MKIKKNLVTFLTLSIFISNTINTSFANILLPNRYEVLEGKYVIINNSSSGELHDIEILGDTVQDKNNLENIQSFGELYVDSKGEPILDNQGRKQYKIGISSANYTDCKRYTSWESGTIGSDGSLIDYSTRIRTKDYIDIGNNKNITIEFSTDLDDSATSVSINMYDENKNNLGDFAWEYGNNKRSFTLNSKTRFIKIKIFGAPHTTTPKNLLKCNLYYDDIAPKKKEVSILLPTQLQKIGDISDRLYWDTAKNKYVIEKNIKSMEVDNSKSWLVQDGQDSKTQCTSFYFNNNIEFYNNKSYVISNNFICDGNDTSYSIYDEEAIKIAPTYGNLLVNIRRDRLTSNNLTGFKSWLEQNPTYILYNQPNSPEIIETNITAKIRIPTYEQVTHIFTLSNNETCPSFKVSIDRISELAQETLEDALRAPTSSNIYLARLCINLLPESLYKDQLQEKLNQLFSTDIVLEKYNTTANLDVYIKSENLLSISLDTNSIVFDSYSGIDEMEKLNAINISINSSLPYSLNAYIPSEIKNTNNTKTMDLSVLNIKESSENTYKTFTNTLEKIILKNDCVKGNNKSHSIDLKLASDLVHEADIYKTVLKFEVQQK